MAEPAGQQNTSQPWRVRVCRATWKGLHFVWGALVLGFLVNVVSSWLITKNFDLAGTPLGWGVDHLWVMLLLLSLLAVLTLLSWLCSHEKRAAFARSPSQQNRDQMLRRLHLRYEQVLAQSLQEAVQMELRLAERSAAVQNVLNLSLHLPNQPERLLPPHTSITQAYDLAQRELLILGEPGAGKSTLLYELAYHLVELAEQDATQPLPVLLPLSSWATKHLPLHDWLVEQVALLYGMSKGLSQQWLQDEQLLPLLDGLDEVEASQRAACIAAINIYHYEHVQPLVVCSRTSEYEAAATKVQFALHGAVVVQPLSKEQVDTYLVSMGKPLEGLHAALQKNTVLQDLATTPLMLQVLMLTYSGTSVPELSHKEAQLRKQIWDDYIRRMVSRKGDARRYPHQRTIAWLGWLARQMREHNQAIFFLELIQLDWLPKGQRAFYRWSVVLFVGLVLGLFVGLTSGLFGGLTSELGGGPLAGLLVGLGVELLFGLHVGLTSKAIGHGLLAGLLGGLLFGLPLALIGGLIGWLGGGPLFGLLTGLLAGLLAGLLFGLLFGLLGGPGVEPYYDQAKYPVWLYYGLAFGLLVGSPLALIGGLIGWLGGGLLVGLLVGLGGGPLLALFYWWDDKQSDILGDLLGELLTEHRMFAPNEGIRRYITAGLFHGLVLGLLTGLFAWLIGWLLVGLTSGLTSGLLFGLNGWLLVGLSSELFGVAQHYILRLWLSRTRLFPWRAVPFLEDATTRILMQRVGGGYQFTHRLLLDYFADLDAHPSLPSTAEPYTPSLTP